MGEIAEMMLEGILCEGCGEFLGGRAPGYPRRCFNCGDQSAREIRSIKRVVGRQKQAERHNRERHEAAKARKPFACNECTKLCRTAAGLADHKRIKHPPKETS